ncbi:MULTISPECIES: GDP-L-fucose synthase family protein [unclassified Sphingomonas]|uniref:GDP-L-fucose synthase family protein n=1 Tax=unclassified Sphingomonas TaxID=196159 RepID=UPI0006F69880|nr:MULTISPECIES: GDP-L-fucose synthase [unclassified Sphingomonas]KQS46250.1 GDP-fucose synthetase [Sphingomonas sp. Leaf198]TCP65964.1 GDP-L-fucose synthase [Sphingomonas sp. PP-CE-1G-424]
MHELVWVAGHNGMVGSAVTRALRAQGRRVLTVDRADLDLTNQRDVRDWVQQNQPSSIIFCAAKVGGIMANDTLPADFLYDNLCIQVNTINAAHLAAVNNLVFLGSSCIYPKFAEQPIKEDSLLTGSLEPTNEWYAIAKIAGLKMCQAYMRQYGRNYISVMPCNLYGPGDNFDLRSSHVMPALIRKIVDAKRQGNPTVQVWGSGKPMREFLHVDDLAAGVVFCHDNYTDYEHINCGSGSEVTIRELAETIASVVGYEGELAFDTSKPDGTPRKVMDSSRLRALGWAPRIELVDGIRSTVAAFLEASPAE